MSVGRHESLRKACLAYRTVAREQLRGGTGIIGYHDGDDDDDNGDPRGEEGPNVRAKHALDTLWYRRHENKLGE